MDILILPVLSYLNSHNLYNTFQSAYRPGHSAEAALLKVVDDLFLSLNKGNMIILSLYSVSILTLDLPILSFNGFHLI